ncbi:MAG: geranylgeranylglyceryl/heptaprenylglyceryl phosphate synthase, partial [Methanotrichaceae archaeon]
MRLSRLEDEVKGKQVRISMTAVGRVEEWLNDAVKSRGAAHLTLIDPDSQSPAEAAKIAEAAALGRTDAIMVGGSVGAAGLLLYETVEKIKQKTDLPVVLFPSSVAGLC